MADDRPADMACLENVEFPSPRSDCVAAVGAVRAHILEHDGATKAETVSALVPENNRPIGHNGVAARAKGFEPGFRERWWNMVEPGLRALPDTDAPDEDGGLWCPVDDDE